MLKFDSDVFIDDDNILNKFIDRIINSNDLELKKRLSETVISSLVNREKKKYGLDLDVSFKMQEKYRKIDGYRGCYDRINDILYVNLDYLNDLKNFNDNFVLCVSTVYHEIRHALQKKDARNNDNISFSKLVMVMDMIMGDIYNSNDMNDFYHDNYDNISFELDAFETSYVKTLRIFDKYPEIIDNYKKYIVIKNDNYIRKDCFGSYEVIFLFLKKINYILKSDKSFIDNLIEYPIIIEFFEASKKDIKFKSDRYFLKKLKKLEKEDKSLANREMIHAIKMILYEKKVYNYLDTNKSFIGINDDLDKKIIANVGRRP